MQGEAMDKIAFIGLGEAASALITGWGAELAGRIIAYDIKLDDPATAPEIRNRALRLGIECADSAQNAVAGAGLIFSTVTADQAVAAAQSAAPHVNQGAYWCDLNSCAPSSKRIASGMIEAAQGRYVDVAVMAPVHPKLNMVPLLIAGPHADQIAPVLQDLPMSPRVIRGEIGAASSIKMIRSVMVKGLEALTAECVLAAVAAGVEEEVLGSLNKSHPGTEWDGQAAYNFERSLVHGLRRAAEMEEVVKTLSDLGLPSEMTEATVKWQRRIANAGVRAPENARAVGARQVAQDLLQKIRIP